MSDTSPRVSVVVVAEGRYARDGPRVLAPHGTPGADREAVATFVGATPVSDRAVSVGAKASC